MDESKDGARKSPPNVVMNLVLGLCAISADNASMAERSTGKLSISYTSLKCTMRRWHGIPLADGVRRRLFWLWWPTTKTSSRVAAPRTVERMVVRPASSENAGGGDDFGVFFFICDAYASDLTHMRSRRRARTRRLSCVHQFRIGPSSSFRTHREVLCATRVLDGRCARLGRFSVGRCRRRA